LWACQGAGLTTRLEGLLLLLSSWPSLGTLQQNAYGNIEHRCRWTWTCGLREEDRADFPRMKDKETFEVDPTLGTMPFAASESRSLAASSLEQEGKSAMRSNVSIEDPPTHATDGGQLPPVYDPSWSALRAGEAATSGPAGPPPPDTLHSSTTHSDGASGYSHVESTYMDEKRPLVEPSSRSEDMPRVMYMLASLLGITPCAAWTTEGGNK
jgi:hypothetical protein